MADPVSLREVIDGMEMQSDELHSYLDKSTNEIVSFTDEMLSAAENNYDPEDFPSGKERGSPARRRCLNPGRT